MLLIEIVGGRWGLHSPASDSQLLAIIRAAHSLLATGDAEAARDLLASFSSPGVDALC